MEITIGQEYKRQELHKFFGGQARSGISTPKEYPYIFLFTHERGKVYGYSDGWLENDSLFHYAGEGQKGDMEFQRGNKALRDHVVNDKRIFLFSETKKTFVLCVAELRFFEYEFTQIPDETGKNRRGIKFFFKKIPLESSSKVQAPNRAHTLDSEKPNETERRGLVTSRVGQGKYRQDLLKKFGRKCAVTNNDIEEVLIASHIVPWKDSSDEERLDPDNGILLSPLYDALFDKHIITFQDDGAMEISSQYMKNLSNLNIAKTLKIDVSEGMKKYLKRHREQFRD